VSGSSPRRWTKNVLDETAGWMLAYGDVIVEAGRRRLRIRVGEVGTPGHSDRRRSIDGGDGHPYGMGMGRVGVTRRSATDAGGRHWPRRRRGSTPCRAGPPCARRSTRRGPVTGSWGNAGFDSCCTTRGIAGREDRAMLGRRDAVEELDDFGGAEHHGQCLRCCLQTPLMLLSIVRSRRRGARRSRDEEVVWTSRAAFHTWLTCPRTHWAERPPAESASPPGLSSRSAGWRRGPRRCRRGSIRGRGDGPATGGPAGSGRG
jgi:hypothetical protein